MFSTFFFFLVVSRNFLWGTLPGNFQNFALVPPYVFSKILNKNIRGDPYDFFRFFQKIYKNTLVPPLMVFRANRREIFYLKSLREVKKISAAGEKFFDKRLFLS